MGFKQILPGSQLKRLYGNVRLLNKIYLGQLNINIRVDVVLLGSHHAGYAPDVCRSAIVRPNQDLNRAVLAGLDVFCEMFVLEESRDEDLALHTMSN